jgi:hypothetical protein
MTHFLDYWLTDWETCAGCGKYVVRDRTGQWFAPLDSGDPWCCPDPLDPYPPDHHPDCLSLPCGESGGA